MPATYLLVSIALIISGELTGFPIGGSAGATNPDLKETGT
jgi:hypothetical protein